jgi:hypothetical protein
MLLFIYIMLVLRETDRQTTITPIYLFVNFFRIVNTGFAEKLLMWLMDKLVTLWKSQPPLNVRVILNIGANDGF